MSDEAKLLQKALDCHRKGQFAAAEGFYRQVLVKAPKNTTALHLLGVVKHQTGANAEAEALIRQALALKPIFPEALGNLGIVLHAQGRIEEAIGCYEWAASLRPGMPDMYRNLGVLLVGLGRYEEAAERFEHALSLAPDAAPVLADLALVRQHQGRIGEALGLFERALALDDGTAEIFYNRANFFMSLNRPEPAVEDYRRALALKPGFAEARNNLGNALVALGHRDAAEATYREVVAQIPDHPGAHNNLGNLLRGEGRTAEGLALIDEAIRLKPVHPEAHNNRGIALRSLDRLGDAAAAYREALAQRPDYPEALNNLGNILRDEGKGEDAVGLFERALALKPDFAEAEHNLALTLLGLGRLEQGFRTYESRWRTAQLAGVRREFPVPQWRGEPALGKTILIHAEQGFGDTLQFCRYIPLVAERGLRVVFEAPGPLVRLLASLPGVEEIVVPGESRRAVDLHCPMMSLPVAFRTGLETVPATTPYLAADPALVEDWGQALAGDAGLKVGLVWSGNPRTHSVELAAVDGRRSIHPRRLAPLLDCPGVSFYSLQKTGERAPDGTGIVDFMDAVADFADTAGLIANLDLVIAVDTAVAHLAGALGKPVWLLNRYDTCWRWLRDREDSPWYPTLRQFRQPSPGDWETPLAEMREALERVARDCASAD